MNAAIAKILKDRIQTLPWVELVSGLIKPLIRIDKLQDGKIVRNMFPVSCDYTYAECIQGKYKDLIPDQRKRSIIYFEDEGVSHVQNSGGYDFYKSRLKLVGWVNMDKFVHNGCFMSPVLAQSIRNELSNVPDNVTPYTRIQIQSVSEVPKDATIFSKWSYREEVLQYLMFPFDYFALSIVTDFALAPECAETITLTDNACDS